MTYQEFLALDAKPEGMTTAIQIPHLGIDAVELVFMNNADVVFECLDDYSSLYDVLEFNYKKSSFKEVFDTVHPNHKALAMPDDPEGDEWDTFYEFALFVDTGSEGCPVVYFNAEYQFEEVAPTFEAFYDSLIEID